MSTLPLKPVSVETVIPARERSWNEFSLKNRLIPRLLGSYDYSKKMHWCCDTFNKQFRIESEKFNLWLSPPPISNACRVEDDFDNSILHLKALIIVSTM